MQGIKRTLVLSLSLGTFAVAGVHALGLPKAAIGNSNAAIQEPSAPSKQAPQEPAKSATFTGTVVRDGEQFALRDGSGATYKLDDASKAQPFEGKQVKVTGRLDTEAKLIHVDSIEGVSA